MKTLIVDTHRIVELLQQRGFSKDQAEGLVEAAKEVDTSELATRQDFALVNLKLNIMIGLLSFVATGLEHAAMQRASLSQSERPDFHLHIDEFQNFTTDAFASVLSEARKYGLTTVHCLSRGRFERSRRILH